ncbi:MAG: glycosyltransferase family 39 protein [Acidimicrobiaceae bacterium]|nr:glycosyltransferase family 39 protein [Acidimicrobiaceae bacterium]
MTEATAPTKASYASSLPAWVLLSPLLVVYVVAALLLAPRHGFGGDEQPLLGYAHAILHGHYATTNTMDGDAYLWFGPAIPLLLAPMVWLHFPLEVMRLLCGPLLLWVAVVLFERLLRVRLASGPALAGAFALGLYLPYGYLLTSLAKEELALVFLIATMLFLSRFIRDGARRHALAAGVSLGALTYTRVEYGWVTIALVVAAGAWTLARRHHAVPRRLLAVAVIAVICCVPWLAYTRHVTGRLLYWGNSDGESLFWISQPQMDQLGEWHSVHVVFEDPSLARYRPLFTRLDRLPPLQRNDAYIHIAEHNVEAHPGKYLLNVAANVSRMILAFPYSFVVPIYVLILYGASNLALLAALGRALRRRRRWPPEASALGLLAFLCVAIHVPISADPRMLMPLVPLLLWPAVYARWASITARPGQGFWRHLIFCRRRL